VSRDNIVGTEDGSIQLENARGPYPDQVQSTTFHSSDQLFPRHLFTLYPVPEQGIIQYP
jgi:hypothetical protein